MRPGSNFLLQKAPGATPRSPDRAVRGISWPDLKPKPLPCPAWASGPTGILSGGHRALTDCTYLPGAAAGPTGACCLKASLNLAIVVPADRPSPGKDEAKEAVSAGTFSQAVAPPPHQRADRGRSLPFHLEFTPEPEPRRNTGTSRRLSGTAQCSRSTRTDLPLRRSNCA